MVRKVNRGTCGIIVEEEERLGSAHQDVIHAHRHQIHTYRQSQHQKITISEIRVMPGSRLMSNDGKL